jgi:hypothetical protein
MSRNTAEQLYRVVASHPKSSTYSTSLLLQMQHRIRHPESIFGRTNQKCLVKRRYLPRNN